MGDSTWAVVAAAFIGAATSPIGICLTHWLQNRRANRLDEERKKLLKTMLNRADWKWRNLPSLTILTHCGITNLRLVALTLEVCRAVIERPHQCQSSDGVGMLCAILYASAAFSFWPVNAYAFHSTKYQPFGCGRDFESCSANSINSVSFPADR